MNTEKLSFRFSQLGTNYIASENATETSNILRTSNRKLSMDSNNLHENNGIAGRLIKSSSSVNSPQRINFSDVKLNGEPSKMTVEYRRSVLFTRNIRLETNDIGKETSLGDLLSQLDGELNKNHEMPLQNIRKSSVSLR